MARALYKRHPFRTFRIRKRSVERDIDVAHHLMNCTLKTFGLIILCRSKAKCLIQLRQILNFYFKQKITSARRSKPQFSPTQPP